MTKNFAVAAAVLASLALVACSGGAGGQTPTAGDQTASTPDEADEPAPTEDEATPGTDKNDAEPTGPKRTPTPYEKCEGAYECWYDIPGSYSKKRMFLHSPDGKSCLLDSVELTKDGRAIESGTEGTWTGDWTDFKVEFPHHYYICSPYLPK